MDIYRTDTVSGFRLSVKDHQGGSDIYAWKIIPLPPTERPTYFSDFEDAVGPEWSRNKTQVTPEGGRRFLGQFGSETVLLRLDDLPKHSLVTVSFDLYVILSWDGNGDSGPDVWELKVEGGPTLLQTTFSNSEDNPANLTQAFPRFYPCGDYPARTGAAAINSLGYGRDTVYRLRYSFPHIDDSLELYFAAKGTQPVSDESWGLDNVKVTAHSPAAAHASRASAESPAMHQGDGALTFDGRDDFVVIPGSPSLDLRGSLTLEACVTNDGDTDGQIIWRGDTRARHDPYELHLDRGRMEFRVDGDYGGAVRPFCARSRQPVDGLTHFWTGVYDKDAGMLYLYKDGVQEAAEEIFGDIAYDTSQMWNMVGAVDRGTWQYFKGTIDEIRIWNVARTPEEIRRDTTRRLTGKEEGLVACWRFERGPCQTAHDITAHGNHGVLGASPFPDNCDPTWAIAPRPPYHSRARRAAASKGENLLMDASFENGRHP
jgi:hypothetical protein